MVVVIYKINCISLVSASSVPLSIPKGVPNSSTEATTLLLIPQAQHMFFKIPEEEVEKYFLHLNLTTAFPFVN